jgi:peptidyl-dipeptidase A
MLSMGQSRPWPETLEALTGSRQMDATAILDDFARSSNGWITRQAMAGSADQGQPVGW